MLTVFILILIVIIISLIPFRYPFTKINEWKNFPDWGYSFDYQTTTSIKGIAILMILIGHISGTCSTVVFSPLGCAGVSLFLILSGYGLAESYIKKGLTDFWQNKIIRVLLPYAIIITLLTLISNKFQPIKYILDITGISTTYWYIGYQMKWYLIFYFTMFLIPQYRIFIFILMSIVTFFTLQSLEIEQSIAFIIGILISNNKNALSKISKNKIYIISIITFLIATLFLGLKQIPAIRILLGSHIYSFIQMLQNIFFALFIISFINLLPRRLNNSSFLFFCGVISYEIYLIHFPFYSKVEGNLYLAIGFIICSILMAALFYKFNNHITSIIKNTKYFSKI